MTTSYQWFLARWSKRMCWKDVATAFHVGWDRVYAAVKHAVFWGLEHRDLEGIQAIGVDEVQWHRGHKYQTVAYQLDEGKKRLLWVGPDRTAKTLLRFFRLLGKRRCQALQFVCSDMWQPYRKVIAKKASGAIHVLDRFHIMQRMNKAIDQVRAAEVKRLREDGYEPILKGSRWLLLKRPKNLTDRQAVKLKQIVQYNLESVRSHLMKEDFQRCWEYWNILWAERFLDQWCRRAMRSRIEPMKKVALMLRSKKKLILNWHRAGGAISSGTVEGFNNKLKLITRKSSGFRTQKAYETALYHNLAALPEPQFTHEFFFPPLGADRELGDPLAHAGAVPADVADGLAAPVGDVHHAIGAERHGHGRVEPHSRLRAAADVVAVVVGPPCYCFRKHYLPPYVDTRRNAILFGHEPVHLNHGRQRCRPYRVCVIDRPDRRPAVLQTA